ncbi:hypothetical protein KAT59_08285 [Candidatus Bipolaricaulota bacterium]|nr:hypothetical protein [Candidatus Bipolaricaulota bacterium]
MRRALMFGLLVAAVAFVLMGCGEFRQRAVEAETRIADAEASAQVAEQAAVRNTARLIELERRIEVLEAQVDLLRAEVGASGILVETGHENEVAEGG